SEGPDAAERHIHGATFVGRAVVFPLVLLVRARRPTVLTSFQLFPRDGEHPPAERALVPLELRQRGRDVVPGLGGELIRPIGAVRAEVAEHPGVKLSEERRDRPVETRLGRRENGLEPLGYAVVAHDERPGQFTGYRDHVGLVAVAIVAREGPIVPWEPEGESGPDPELALNLEVGSVH